MTADQAADLLKSKGFQIKRTSLVRFLISRPDDGRVKAVTRSYLMKMAKYFNNPANIGDINKWYSLEFT